jgi:AcrR family transcriptional regulator
MSGVEIDRLLQVALASFAAGGAEGGSIEALAADLGVAPGAVFEHFEDFDELFGAAIAWGTADLERSLEELAGAQASPAERLLSMTRRLGRLSPVECSALFAFLRELLDGTARAAMVYERTLRAPFEVLLRVIGESQFRGETTPLPPRFVATELVCGVVVPQLLGFAGVEATLQGVHARPDDASDDDVRAKPRSALLAASIQVLFHGLLTPSTEAPCR